MDHRFIIHTPLMWLDKAATWVLAQALGGDALVELMIEETHSCYLGDRSHRHPWGYGCGGCPACELRQAGWETFVIRKDAEPSSFGSVSGARGLGVI
jgi:7-cyano-7-deazaguanine synthase